MSNQDTIPACSCFNNTSINISIKQQHRTKAAKTGKAITTKKAVTTINQTIKGTLKIDIPGNLILITVTNMFINPTIKDTPAKCIKIMIDPH